MINKKKVFILLFITSLFFCKSALSYYESTVLEKNISLITKNFSKSTEDIENLIKKYNINIENYKFDLLENKDKISYINLYIKLEDYNLFIKDIENLDYIKLLSKEEVSLEEYIEKVKNIQRKMIEHKKELESKINTCELININAQIELCKLEIEIEEVGKLLEKKDKYINCSIYLEENTKLKNIVNKREINNNYNDIQKTMLIISSLSSYILSLILLIFLVFIIKKIKKVCD